MLKKAMSLVLALLMTFSMAMPALALELETVESVVPTEEIVEEKTVEPEAAEPAAVEPEAVAEPQADTDVVKVEHNGETTYYADLQKAFDGFAPSNNTYGGKYVVTLLADTTGVSKNLQYPTEVLDVTLDLNGKTITGPSGTSTTVVNINFGSKNSKDCVFTIKDSSGNNSGKITGGKQGVIFSGSASIFNFEGGTITGNHGGTTGGGIKLGGNCYFNMTGGVITGNSVSGTSSANTGQGGGIYGVYMNITGGEIYGNTATGGTGKYTGRGGGICTDQTGTSGYHYVNIGSGAKIYGNTAANAGDDVMIEKNANNSSKMTFTITTENWYIDGMNGQNTTSALCARYDAENPVAYTDGGWEAGTKKAIGLKYVASAAEEVAPAAPNDYNVAGDVYAFACNNTTANHQTTNVAFADAYTEVGEPVKNDAGEWTVEVTYKVKASWDEWVSGLYSNGYPGITHEPKEELPENLTVTLKWNSESEKWVYEGERTDYDISCKANVARLESTGAEYETLQEAVDAATALMVDAAGEVQTVTLLADITESVKISWTGASGRPATPTLNIDLNGKTVTAKDGSAFIIGRYGSYTMKFNVVFKDSVGTGVVTGGTGTVNGTNTYGGAIYAKDGSSYITIEGGTWTGNTATNGAVVAAAYSNRTNYVTINGGTITGNTATGKGGAIYGRYVFINGGTITDNTAASGGGVYVFIDAAAQLKMTGGKVYGNTATTEGDDIYWRANKGTSSTAYLQLIKASAMDEALTGWYNDAAGSRFSEDAAVEFDVSKKFTTLKTVVALKAAAVAEKYTVTYTDGVEGEELFADQSYTVKEGEATPAFEGTPEREGYTFGGWDPEVAETVTANVTYTAVWVPAVPEKLGGNVINPFLTVICDTDENHKAVESKWYSTACKVYPSNSAPVWDDTLGAWTIGVRIQSLTVMYVDQMEDANNNILHELVGDTVREVTLKWDTVQELWVPTEAIEIHCTCKTVPDAPVHNQLKSYQIQVYGVVDGEEKLYAINLSEGSYTIGEVKGSREEGFTVDVTVTISEDDGFQSGWIEKRDAEATVEDYVYNWNKTPETITFTLTYNGDLNGTLYGNRHAANTNYDWIIGFNYKNQPLTYGAVGQAYLIPAAPAEPVQGNTTEELVTIICDTDEAHETVYGKWYPQNCKVLSDMVWSEELGTWTVEVRVDSIDWYYVHLALEGAYNDIHHELVSSNYVDTTLAWDAEQGLWVNTEAIEVHAACKTVPDAPVYNQLKSYQIKVFGYVEGEEEAWTTSIFEGAYEVGEVKGSRSEGFTVDVTVTITEDDLFQSTWIEKRAPGKLDSYVYNWDKTPVTVTFTLVYNGSLTGTLYGDRHASNTNYDWVLSTTEKTWGVVGEAYLSHDVTVTYKDAVDGAAFADQVYTVATYSETPAFEGTPARTGYTFAGWYPEVAETVTEDVEYVAMWIANEYTVTFDANNGEVDPESKTVVYDAAVGELPVPTRTGYTFAGWTDEDGDPVNAETVYTVAGDSTYVAMWIANEYTVTFDANGGEVDPESKTVIYEHVIGELPVPEYKGRVFTGWYLDGKKVESDYVVTGDVTLTAGWAIIETHEHEWSDWETLNGVKYRECKHCGIVEKIYVSATGKTDEESNPNTGAPVESGSAISAMAAIAVLSAAAYVCGKRK